MTSEHFVNDGLPITVFLSIVADPGFKFNMLEEWKDLASALKVPPSFIEKVQVDAILYNRNVQDILTDILIEWKIRCSHLGSTTNLVSILEANPKFKEIADQIRSKLRKSHDKNTDTSNSWVSLPVGTRADILSKDVHFLGVKQRLFQVANRIGEKGFLELMEQTLSNSEFVKILVKCKELELTKNVFPEPTPNYVERFLVPMTRLDPKIFANVGQDILAIEGIDWSTLSVLADSPYTEKSGNITSSLDNEIRFILLEQRDHFEIISRLTKNNVHLISYTKTDADANLTWVRTKGSTQILTDYMKTESNSISESNFVEETLVMHNKSVVLLSSLCGGGKSALLISLARKVQKAYQDRVVLFLRATDLLKKFVEQGTLRDHVSIVEILASHLAQNKENFTSKLLLEILKSQNSKIELFIEGYHDASLEQRNIADKIISELYKSRWNIRIFLTSQFPPTDMDQHVTLIRYKVLDFFDDVDPAKYLETLWSNLLQIQDNKQIQNFAQACIPKVYPTRGLSQSSARSTVMPMQLKVFAELNVKQAEAALYSQNVDMDAVEMVTSEYQLYKKYFATKYSQQQQAWLSSIAMEQIYWNTSNTKTPSNLGNRFRSIPPDVSDLVAKNWFTEEYILNQKSFAEFFVAQAFIQILTQNGNMYPAISAESIWQFVFSLENNSTNFVHSTICYFLNEMFQDFGLLNDTRILEQIQSYLQRNLPTFPLCKALQACTQRQFYSLFCLLGHCIDFVSPDNKTLNAISINDWKTLLFSATQNANVDLIKKFCQKVKLVEKKPLHEIQFSQEKCLDVFATPLHIAIRRGNYKIFQYFVGEYGQNINDTKRLLHVAVENSLNDGKQILEDKLEIVKYLIQKSKENLLEKDADQDISEPVLMPGIHLNILKHLIQCTQDITSVKTRNNETIAHKATMYLNATDYHQLAQMLIENKQGTIFNQRDHQYKTGFELALKNLKIGNMTVKMIIECEDVEADPHLGYKHTLMYHLLINGYSDSSVFDAALRKPSGWKEDFSYKDGSTTLLHEAADCGNLEALKYFILKGAPVNALNKDRKTPLHIACEKRQSRDHLPERVMEAVSILMNSGAPIDAKDKEGRNPLSLFFENHLMPVKNKQNAFKTRTLSCSK